MNKLLTVLAALVLAATPLAGTAQAAYPDKPVKLIVPYPPGSGTDTVARYTARRLEGTLGQPVVVENRTGGNAIIAAQTVINAPADGYTLLWAANGPVTTNVALYEKLPYDPLVDFVPVARVAYSPMGLFVPADSPYKTATELLDKTKSDPLKLNYGSGSATYNIATEWLLSIAGGRATAINYKGSAPTIADLAGGQVNFAIAELSAALPLVKAGKLKLLAVTSEKRMPNTPDVPTLQELGYGDFFQVAWWGVFAPKATPADVVRKMEKSLLDIYADAQSKAYLDENNFSAFMANGQELHRFQKSEIEREVGLVKKFNIPRL
ncbi:Bug family tripartite tricarboxylate transporter substrate binding protein [Bordetella genomosp. 13]|uniref:Bug family tripartite tricarboxylate transporter substrate binding protein n=1 Tax=Bordetella genomosp. 13 TaxID=463040 RepID=UPI0011A4C930|nr:tripartite tricarboxylate transporter substrate binding protein [Bordetella genomosp. 13]